MTWAIALKAIEDLAPKLRQPRKVRFFGGEPLLRWDIVRRALERGGQAAPAARYELVTNGILLDDKICRFLAKHPEVETVLSRLAPIAKHLPHVSQSILIRPGDRAEVILEQFSTATKMGIKKFNFLPAYYVSWREDELNELDRTLRGLGKMIVRLKERGCCLQIKNLDAHGSIPLFNDGITVDCDGRLYASNLILAAKARGHCGPLQLGQIEDGLPLAYLPDAETAGRVLRRCFDAATLDAARRVDALLTGFVHGLESADVGRPHRGLR